MFRFTFLPIIAVLGGCSIHPIPDDVSRRYSTADIIRNVRCEAKMAVRERIDRALDQFPELRTVEPDLILEPANLQRIHRTSARLAETFQNYKDSSIAYEFKFEITEINHAGGSLGFRMPWSSGSLAAGVNADLNKTRYGQREYDSSETFGELAKLRCDDFEQPRRNIVYPMTGSIGMRRIMNTFIDLSEMGGVGSSGQEVFTDTITFTTTVRGDLDAQVVALRAVPHQFRVISGAADIGASREDIHQVIVTMKFPTRDLRVARVDSFDDRAAAHIDEAERSRLQALENLCIARAQQREERLGTVRLFPPEIYCRQPEAVANEVVLPRSAVSVRAREARAAAAADRAGNTKAAADKKESTQKSDSDRTSTQDDKSKPTADEPKKTDEKEDGDKKDAAP